MKFDLAQMALAQGKRKRDAVLANIRPTQAQAGDLAAIYLRIVAAWSLGIPRIVAEYERTIAAMTTDSPSDVQGSIDGVAAEINRLVLLLTPDLRRWALRTESVHRGKWARSVLSATDIDLNTVLTAGDVNDTVEASINWNVALIRDISNEEQQRISNAVFAGFQLRAPAAEIAKEIREASSMARARSIRVASDQVTKLGSQLNEARQKQAGLSKYRWRHSAKRHPRPVHLARDGKIYPWNGPGSVPRGDRAGEPPYCGCTAAGVVTFDSE